MSVPENLIEANVVKYAREKGFVAYKWSSPSTRGVHDYLFFKAGLVFTIEFKATGKKATPLQKKVAEELTVALIPCRVIDNFTEGREFIDKMDEACKSVLCGASRVYKEIDLRSFTDGT